MREFLSYTLFESGNYSLRVGQVLAAIFILILTKVLLVIIRKVVTRRLKGKDKGRFNSLVQILGYFVWTLAILSAMQAVGVKLNVILAGGAALLVGLGLGLQSLFHDFVSGIIILLEGTIEVGDVIEVDGTVGRVKKINLRNSQVSTLDNYGMLIPNHYFISEKVINWSHAKGPVRFNVDVGVAYGSNTEKVVEILEKVPAAFPDVSNEHKTYARFDAFGESSLDFKLFFWSNKPFQIEPLKSDIRLLIDKRFREGGVTIPFPQRDLHVIPPKNPEFLVQSTEG